MTASVGCSMLCAPENLCFSSFIVMTSQGSALRWDGYRNGTLPAEFMGNRALRGESFPGGTVTMLVNMMEFKKCLITDACK